MPTDFKQILQSLDLHEIDKLRQAKQAITYLQGRRQQLQQEIAEIDKQMAAIMDGSIDPASVIPKSSHKLKSSKSKSGRRANSGSLASMILEVLKDKPAGLKVTEITDSVLGAGYKTTAKNFGTIVGIKVSRMQQLERVSHGVYRLKQ